MGPAGAPSTIVLPHGTVVTYSPTGRRIHECDRHGHDLAFLSWREDGALAEARVRIPDGSWLTIEPRATTDAPWGAADRVWHRGESATVFTAVDYARIEQIPTVADPARLPPGGGTAVLNLIASLALDQGRPRLTYRGPYPSEQLFLSLLESFRYEGGADPLSAFARGALAWVPAPHERFVAAGEIWIQARHGIEKIVWDGRAYYRSAWQDVRRHAPYAVREAGGAVICSLEALGAVVADHLRLRADGEVLEVLPPAPSRGPVSVAAPPILRGVAAAVAARSAPALGPFIRAAGAELTLEWGPLPRELVRLDGMRLRLSRALVPIARERLDGAADADAKIAAAVAVVSELAHLTGDVLRARAQARAALLSPAAQAALLEGTPDPEANAAARAIADAVRALPAELGDGVQDQLDVEGNEGADR